LLHIVVYDVLGAPPSVTWAAILKLPAALNEITDEELSAVEELVNSKLLGNSEAEAPPFPVS
jgi:hypothetical protein